MSFIVFGIVLVNSYLLWWNMNDRSLVNIFCSPGSTHTRSMKKKEERIGQKCVPLTHVRTHISLHCWNFDVEKGFWAVKRLCLAGRRFYRGQAGRHSENCISVKQIKMWYFKQDLSTIFCCRMKTANICVFQFNVLVGG